MLNHYFKMSSMRLSLTALFIISACVNSYSQVGYSRDHTFLYYSYKLDSVQLLHKYKIVSPSKYSILYDVYHDSLGNVMIRSKEQFDSVQLLVKQGKLSESELSAYLAKESQREDEDFKYKVERKEIMEKKFKKLYLQHKKK